MLCPLPGPRPVLGVTPNCTVRTTSGVLTLAQWSTGAASGGMYPGSAGLSTLLTSSCIIDSTRSSCVLAAASCSNWLAMDWPEPLIWWSFAKRFLSSVKGLLPGITAIILLIVLAFARVKHLRVLYSVLGSPRGVVDTLLAVLGAPRLVVARTMRQLTMRQALWATERPHKAKETAGAHAKDVVRAIPAIPALALGNPVPNSQSSAGARARKWEWWEFAGPARSLYELQEGCRCTKVKITNLQTHLKWPDCRPFTSEGMNNQGYSTPCPDSYVQISASMKVHVDSVYLLFMLLPSQWAILAENLQIHYLMELKAIAYKGHKFPWWNFLVHVALFRGHPPLKRDLGDSPPEKFILVNQITQVFVGICARKCEHSRVGVAHATSLGLAQDTGHDNNRIGVKNEQHPSASYGETLAALSSNTFRRKNCTQKGLQAGLWDKTDTQLLAYTGIVLAR
ncbi:hypothetical protein BDV93DRAFT_514875 [Ceratobasidium sp. AG-I]|nr:hypothetical protein BDV93DRAFT_514875 [Ceratobasidium sp. AG-I]